MGRRFAIGYVSVNTVDSGTPLDAQHYEISDCCKSLDFTPVKVEGEVIRAGKPVDQRDALLRALWRCGTARPACWWYIRRGGWARRRWSLSQPLAAA